jgi:putative transposase
MKKSKNILTDKEIELVSLLMQDCESTGVTDKLKWTENNK